MDDDDDDDDTLANARKVFDETRKQLNVPLHKPGPLPSIPRTVPQHVVPQHEPILPITRSNVYTVTVGFIWLLCAVSVSVETYEGARLRGVVRPMPTPYT